MKAFVSRHGFILLGAGIGLVLAAFLTVGAVRALMPDKSPYPVTDWKAPHFEMEDLQGKKVNFADTNGKVRLVYFFYSLCPDVCGPGTFLMSQVQDELKKKDVFGKTAAFYSITIDPKRDTRERLTEFSSGFHPDRAGWSFLRGEQAETDKATKGFKMTIVPVPETGDFTHMNVLLLVDGKGNVRHYYNAGDPELDSKKIADDIVLMAKELD